LQLLNPQRVMSRKNKQSIEVEMQQINQFRANHGTQQKAQAVETLENYPPKAKIHACKASQRGYQLASDRLKRAERDLAETAAFIAASLTTVTAIQAVISIARDKLDLSKEVLQVAFQGYVAIFILIFLLGALRIRGAIRRRTEAETEIDQTKKGIFEFCDPSQWPKPEE
jgi:hypothetical protein